MLAIADQSGSEVQQINARMWAAIVRHHMGELTITQKHADICIALGTPQNQAGAFDWNLRPGGRGRSPNRAGIFG